MSQAKSYSSEGGGVAGFIREAWALLHLHSRDVPRRVRERLENVREIEGQLKEVFGVELKGRSVLEVGPGQFLIQMSYLAVHNETVGIDTDMIVRGFRPWDYAVMLKTTGARRTAKTVARKLLGIDRKYALELMRQLDLKQLPRLTVHPMDVCKMSFESNSFDFVFCRSVLHHLRNPMAAIEELDRVLRPGGIAYVSIHPYTSQTGCLDPRIYTDSWREVAPWSHLRPKLQDSINKPNAFLNRLRLDEWRRLFTSRIPESKFVPSKIDTDAIGIATQLQDQGELLDYSIEELTTGELAVLWQKPAPSTS